MATDTCHRGGHPGGHAGYPPYSRVDALVSKVAERAPGRGGVIAAGFGIAVGAAYTLLVHTAPDATPNNCIVRMFTGFDCPGCGGTRSAWYLMHGDIVEAARHHALFVFVAPFLAYMYIAWAANAFGLRLPMLRLSNRVLLGFMGIWLAFSVLRNLPWAPFTLLYI